MVLTRKEQLLKLIVEDFIKTAQPVGSNYLIEKYGLKFSSATIRNEMNLLEKEGLLEKTHTSSGRVPSTLGYKYYVEHLRNKEVDDSIKSELRQVFDNSTSIEEVIKASCEILSHMTNLASVVLGPNANDERLVSVQLVPLNKQSVTAIFVTDKGYVENKTFGMNEKFKIEDLTKCIEILNDRLKGTKVNELVPKLESIEPILSNYITNYSYIYNALLKTFYEFASNRGEFYGKENLLSQPEFGNDAEELKKIFGLLNKPSDLEKIIEETSGNLMINCGEVDEDYNDVSVISKDIVANGNNVAKIAIIGPTRMDYEKVLNNLDYVVDKIMEKLNYGNVSLEGEEPDEGREE